MKGFVQINAWVFLLYGVAFGLFPEAMSQFITDGFPNSNAGMIDLRATYGGISLGFALLLFYMAREAQNRLTAVIAIILIVGGMAVCRALGIILDGPSNSMMYIYLIVEIVVVILGLRIYFRKSN